MVMQINHILFGGLGGHGSVVFSIVRASGPDVEHRLLFVGTSELLGSYAAECERLGVAYTHHRTSGGLDVQFHRSVVQTLMANDPDAILVHSSGSLPSALLVKGRRPRTKVIMVEHQAWDLRTRRHRLATFLGLAIADHTVVLSQAFRDRLQREHPRLARRARIAVIPNGIEVERFVPTPEPVHDDGSRPVRLGMQARLLDIKDHESLIRAIPIVAATLGREVHLELAGDGKHRPHLEAVVASLGLQDTVRFLGMLPECDLIPYLQGLDVYVHASLGEAMSTALLQAMSTGLPVVASSVPGIADVLAGHDVVLLVPPGCPEAYADAIASLATDAGRRSVLGSSARDFVTSDCSSSVMWQRYHSLIKPADSASGAPVMDLVRRSVTSGAGFGISSDDRLCLWPRSHAPRVVWRAQDDNVGRWLQRSGILGGGKSPGARWASRQRIAWPMVRRRAETTHLRTQGPDTHALATLLAKWVSAWLPGCDASSVRLGFLARNAVNPRRGLIAVFIENHSSPSAVVKVSLDQLGHSVLRREHQVLQQLSDAASPELAARLPRPLGCHECGDVAAAAFTPLPGVLLVAHPTLSGSFMARRTLHRYLDAVSSISRELSQVASGDSPQGGELLSDTVDRFTYFADVPAAMVSRLDSLRTALDGAALQWTPVWQHGDLAHGNVLFHRGEARAVDWELAGDAYPPWFDEAYAILMLMIDHPAEVGETPADGRHLRRWLERSWRYDVPVGWALVLTAMQAWLRSIEIGRGGHQRWRQLGLALLGDEDLRRRSNWLVPQW
jgi:glycosyltransferase involved in cell wall biosynthesis/thiamine kinase-like enzyme